jgi:hypothetical protein
MRKVLVCLCCVLMISSLPALAATVPDAGSLLREQQQPERLPDSLPKPDESAVERPPLTDSAVILVTGGSVSTGAGGFATLYSGSVAGSTGLTALVGSGTNRFRYNSDEASGTSNYTTALVAGTNAVYREQPTVTTAASDDSKVYSGAAYSGGNGVTYAGLANGDTSAILGGVLAYGGTSQGAINAGTYTIIPGGYTNGRGYALAYANGGLTITGAPAPAPARNPAISNVVASITSFQNHVNGTQDQADSGRGMSNPVAAGMGPGAGSGNFEGNDLGGLISDRTGYLTDEERRKRF